MALFLFSYSYSSKATLEQFCEELNGRIENGGKCPNTSFPLMSKVCHFENQYQETHFTDGCTGPSGGHRDIFLSACIKHDLCYHHEPASSGKSQKQCDDEFLENLLKSCFLAEDLGHCQKWAKVMHRSLRTFGALAYRCDNTKVSTYLGRVLVYKRK